jgi:hypothetical protein
MANDQRRTYPVSPIAPKTSTASPIIMKTSFATCISARNCFLLFVFISLPLSNIQGESSLGRTIGVIKHRVDRALHKVGIKKGIESLPSEDKPEERKTELVDPRDVAAPKSGQQAPPKSVQEQPPSKSVAIKRNASKKHAPSIAAKPSSKSQTKPAAVATVPPTGEKRQPTDAGISKSSAKTNVEGSNKAVEPDTKPEEPLAKVSFAKPVPGKRGFVYPPGVDEDVKNILDVRGADPGQKMRDPTTGTVFLVP